MPVAEPHVDLSKLDFSRPIAGIEAIRQYIPQRPPFEMLTAIVRVDGAPNHLIVAYKDVTAEEFWVPGHMPGYPLLPGVLMCEAAAQLCSYYVVKVGLLGESDFIGFGGLENVRFRNPVHPGERLVLIGKETKFNRRQMIFNVQGFVKDKMVFHGDIIGVPLKKGEE